MSSTKPEKEEGREDRFAYRTMASKVQKQDRSHVTKDEPTGESDRLTTAHLIGAMGSAVRNVSTTTTTKKIKRKKDDLTTTTKAASSYNPFEDLLQAGGSYEPSTKATEKVWENFLTQVMKLLTDVPRDVLRSAAEEVLNILKDPERPAREKRNEVEDLLSEMSDEQYRSLVEQSELLTDFVVQSESGMKKKSKKQDTEIAIVFEEDEEGGGDEDEEDDDKIENEVVSASESEPDDDDNNNDSHKKKDKLRSKKTEDSMMEDGDDNNNNENEEGLLDPHSIDAYWLQREISASITDPQEVQIIAEKVLEILGDTDTTSRENLLVPLLGYDSTLVKKFLRNRAVIYYCTRLLRSQTEQERENIKEEMVQDPTSEGRRILQQLSGEIMNSATTTTKNPVLSVIEATKVTARKRTLLPSGRLIDFSTFSRINPRKLTSQIVLPKGSWSKTLMKSWEEVHIRPYKTKPLAPGEKMVLVSDLPDWMKPAFDGMTDFNRVQSKVFPAIMNPERFNMLVAAPTGSGKTNVAMLAVMNEVGAFLSKETGKLDLNSMKERMKIVYIAPMKALVQEVVNNFSSRLTAKYGIQVRELSGDSQLSRAELANTQIIVTTPEKWDVVTRKAGERSYVSLVRLIVIDEIHLLHDSRGAVLEAVVARTLRSNEESQAPCRILGVSATLPNYQDVAIFLRVPLDRGLFFFDNSFRPVPLQQIFIGVTDQKAVTRMKTMDQVCHEKVNQAATANQVLVFVHSRKDTVKTAKMLRDRAEESNTLQNYLPSGIHSQEVLIRAAGVAGDNPSSSMDDSNVAKSADLKYLLPSGIAVHHAGMHKSDRKLVEDLFADGHVRVLVSTATLAWGVNLPAHTVVIKGTQVYNPELGRWTELSQLDILQMLGRAGRPQYDVEGEGIVITSHAEMQYYLSLLNDQLPVESSLLKKLPDHVNAEIVCGNVASLEDVAHWLGYSFLLVRAIKHPDRYAISNSTEEEDKDLIQWRIDLAHAAFQVLEKCQLVRYDRKSGMVQGTPLGRIASHYYLTPDTVSNFSRLLDSNMTEMDIIRILTSADEFKQIQVRHEEKNELSSLMDRVPIPIKESLEDPSSKVNVLIQAYISKSPLDGYCLACDLVYVHQSAGRLIRALFEMCLYNNWATASRKCLELCLSIDRRLWKSHIPLRQFSNLLSEDILKMLEKRSLSFNRYFDLSTMELGSFVKEPKLGTTLHRIIKQFPKIDIHTRVQTLTKTVVKIELSLTADFQYEESVHGPALVFWILCEDVDGNELLHNEPFILKSKFAEEEHFTSFIIQLSEPTPPYVFIRLESDSFLHSTSVVPVSLSSLTFPPKASPFTELLDLSPILVKDLHSEFAKEYLMEKQIDKFWSTQTQAYSLIESDDSNLLICSPVGKSLLGDLSIIKCFDKDANARVVYIVPSEERCQTLYLDWSSNQTLSKRKKSVVQLLGNDSNTDLALLQSCHLAICTSKVWEVLTRRWKQKSKKVVTEVSLLLVDELNAFNTDVEIVLSRTRYLCAQLDKHIRIVALSCPLTNAEDVASWLDAKFVNFSPSARPFPTEIIVKGLSEAHFETRMGSMSKPCYRLLNVEDEKTIIFLPSKRHVRLLVIDFIHFLNAEGKNTFTSDVIMEQNEVIDSSLKSALNCGVGFLHESLNKKDFDHVQNLFIEGKIRLLLTSYSICDRLKENLRGHHSILMSTSTFQNKRYSEYPLHVILKLLGKACIGPTKCTQTVFCYQSQKEYYKKFLLNGFNLESELHLATADVLLGEIVTKTIESKQDAVDFFTWTLFYRRLVRNPSYYGVKKKQGIPSDEILSSYLSDTVENVISELRELKCLEEGGDREEENEDSVQPSSLGIIASFHDVKCSTIDLFASSLNTNVKLASLLEILSSASEFIEIASVRVKEDVILEKLARNSEAIVYKLSELNFFESYVKCNILLQAWCSRFPLSVDQREDVTKILKVVPKLLHSLVDVASSNGWLKQVLLSLELCQTVIQQVWPKHSPLAQVPYYETHLKKTLNSKITTVYDLLEMEDSARDEALKVLDENQLSKVAQFCNTYPSLAVSYQFLLSGGNRKIEKPKMNEKIPLNEEFSIEISFEKDFDDSLVISDKFPHEKSNFWWAILGEFHEETGEGILHAIKKVANDSAKLTCEFNQKGKKKLKLFIVCDSYVGCDQKFDLDVEVV